MPCHRASALQAQAGLTKGHAQQNTSPKKYTGTPSNRLDHHKVQLSWKSISPPFVKAMPAGLLKSLLLLLRTCNCVLHAAAQCTAEGLCCLLLSHLITMQAAAIENVNVAGCSVQLLQRSALCTKMHLGRLTAVLQHSSSSWQSFVSPSCLLTVLLFPLRL